MWAVCFAILAEACKPLLAGGSANIANVFAACCGAAAGMVMAMWSGGRVGPGMQKILAVVLLGAYICYLQLDPFVFVWDPPAMWAKAPTGPQWLPLYHYAISGRSDDVIKFARTIVLLGALTYAISLTDPANENRSLASQMLRAAMAGGAIGLVLEACQFLLPGRYPSVTDVFCFALGAAAGAWIFARGPHRLRQGECISAEGR